MSARVEITPMTTEQLARLSINLAGGNPNLDHIARIYRSNAATMRDIAAKAKAHPKGKSRGYTCWFVYGRKVKGWQPMPPANMGEG